MKKKNIVILVAWTFICITSLSLANVSAFFFYLFMISLIGELIFLLIILLTDKNEMKKIGSSSIISSFKRKLTSDSIGYGKNRNHLLLTSSLVFESPNFKITQDIKNQIFYSTNISKAISNMGFLLYHSYHNLDQPYKEPPYSDINFYGEIIAEHEVNSSEDFKQIKINLLRKKSVLIQLIIFAVLLIFVKVIDPYRFFFNFFILLIIYGVTIILIYIVVYFINKKKIHGVYKLSIIYHGIYHFNLPDQLLQAELDKINENALKMIIFHNAVSMDFQYLIALDVPNNVVQESVESIFKTVQYNINKLLNEKLIENEEGSQSKPIMAKPIYSKDITGNLEDLNSRFPIIPE